MLKPFAFYLFAVPWTAFSLSWETIAVRMAFTGAPPLVGIIMTLFGLPFVVIGNPSPFGSRIRANWHPTRAGGAGW